MPRLILVDAGSEFKDMLIKTCQVLSIGFHVVSCGNHKAILSERFHQYLNKVQQIYSANCKSYDKWIKGVHYACYAWNTAPIDGTNVAHSYAAMGRKSPFPLDVALDPSMPNFLSPGQWSLEHMEATFPLFRCQQAFYKHWWMTNVAIIGTFKIRANPVPKFLN